MYQNKNNANIFLPIVVKVDPGASIVKTSSILETYPNAIVLDLFSSQKKELFKIQNPKKRLSSDDLDRLYEDWLKEKKNDTGSTWVYYPWSNRLIHILNKKEFIQLRTSRNQYKISPKEQISLFEKKIGIIGLSVGNAVAINLATERVCGRLKLADFDIIELSNLNRLKTGIHNTGLNKCIVTAREIAEIDPFIEIECFLEGINDDNMIQFLSEGGKLDILIDECDDLEMKIACREMAKNLEIPVLMETSDRGMMDVERFDRDHNLPIFHGLLNGVPREKFRNISPQDRVLLTLKILDAMKGSPRGKVSFLEVGQTINTWPQLASAVTLGGGVVTDVSRRILLGQFTDSGRYYVDLDEIIGNKQLTVNRISNVENPNFDLKNAIQLANSVAYKPGVLIPSEENIRQIVEAGSRAPSSGNDQPWKWLFMNGRLDLFHDQSRSYSFANYQNMSANISLGAAYENVVLKSKELGYQVRSEFFPLGMDSDLIVSITFQEENGSGELPVYAPDLVDYIYSRSTNRSKSVPFALKDSDYTEIQKHAESIDGVHLHYISDSEKISQMARIVAECDLIMLLNSHGHQDFFERDIKWTPDETRNANDGISVHALGNAPAQLAALSLIRDKKIADTLRQIGGGNALVEGTFHSLQAASCIAVITTPGSSAKDFFRGGIAVQRMWLRAEQLGLAIQPLLSPVFLFQRLQSGSGLKNDELVKLKNLRKRFQSITILEKNSSEIFLFKISKAEQPLIQSKRLPLSEILFIVTNET